LAFHQQRLAFCSILIHWSLLLWLQPISENPFLQSNMSLTELY